ncbi:MAG: aminotransferase class V-fold PLP-dependent enzyme [Chloroflexi bacterium]|nr:aminotransferase class V-fold PLP-dependent enzyme [Chloroflexota bacterium]
MDIATLLSDHGRIRDAFPSLREVNNLNTGTYGIMPEPALAEFIAALAEFESYGVGSRGQHWPRIQAARQGLARLIGATPDDIAFTGNATDGNNLALAGMPWQAGDEIIITTEEHEAIYHPVLFLHQHRGVQMRRVEVSPDAEVMLQRCEAVRSPRTRLLMFSHVTCETGTRLPAAAMCAWARANGIQSFVDCAQSVGACSVNVNELGCDYLSSNAHKWLCGPKGTGFFYARPERMVQLVPAHVGAGSLARADLATGEAVLQPNGRRFEYGTRAHMLFVGVAASLAWFDALGWPNVHGHIACLASYLKQSILARKHLQLLTPLPAEQSAGLTACVVIGHNASDVSVDLRRDGRPRRIAVRVVPHYNAIRIATAHFNSLHDIDEVMSALDEYA